MKRSTNRKILAIFFAMLMFVEMLPTSLVSALADNLTVDSSSVQVQSNSALLPEGANGTANGDTVSVKVEKIWVNTEINEIPGNVTIRLKASYGVPGLDIGTSTTIYEVTIPHDSYGTSEQDRIVGEVVAGIPLKDADGYTLANIYYDSEDAGNSQLISTTVSYTSGATEGTVTVINTIKKDITVQKVWDGVNPSDYSEVVFELTYGDVTLTASASKVGSIWRNATFTNIPMADANGDPYTFTVREVSIDGNTNFSDDFTTSITGNEHEGFICTNIKKQDIYEKVTVRVTKNWNGGSGFASSTVRVSCIAHANCITDTQTLYKSGSSTSQSYDFEMPLYTEGLGTPHRYVVTEIGHTGNYYARAPYLAESTNSRQVWVIDNDYDSIDLVAEKHWVGDEGNEGYRVDVTLTLWRRDSQGNEEQVYVGGSPVFATIKKDEINSSGIGTNTISGMKRFDDYGGEYEYYVKEPVVPSGYTAVTSGMTVTNIWIDPNPDISIVLGVKEWDANDHKHGAYPAVNVYLEVWNGTAWVRMSGGPIVIPSSTTGTVIFQSIVSTYGPLDRSKSYRLVEESSDGRWSYTGGQIIWIENTGIGYVVLTNKLLVDIDEPPVDPENEFEEIYIRKTWNFAGSSMSNMVSKYTIHISGQITTGLIEKLSTTGDFTIDTDGNIVVTLTGDDSITLKVPKYTSTGVRVTYTVEEDPIEGFISTVQSWYNAYVFTNTQITNNITVNKIWENIEIRGNYNLGALTLELQRVFESNDSWSNPETVEIITISSWNPVDGNTFTASKSFAQSYPTHGMNSSGSIEAYKYRVVESSNLADVAFFSMQGNALVVDGSATLTNVYKTELVEREILVEKIWEGEHIPAGEEYPAVEIVVSNGDGFEETIVFNASTSAVQSKKISVPKYATDASGVFLYEYMYTVVEKTIAGDIPDAEGKVTVVTGEVGSQKKRIYTRLGIEETGNTIFIVRNHAVDPDWVETMALYGKKVWDTVEGVDLPNSVTFLLYADGVQIRSVDLYATDSWQVKFENLPIYNTEDEDNIKTISYTLREIAPEGYTGSLDQSFAPTPGYDAFVGILRNTPSNLPTYTIEFVKAWDAINSISALYKDVTDSITLHLKVAHTTAYVYEVKLVKGTDGIWRTTTTLPALYIKGYDAENNNAPIYDTITYTIEEFEFAGHALQGITVDGANIHWVSKNQFQIINTDGLPDKTSVGTVTLTNELKEPKIKVWGGKFWDDAGFAEDYRPASLIVTLQRSINGNDWVNVPDYTNYSVTGGKTGNWVWGDYEVDKYDRDTGAVYQYRWVEADANVPAGYECTIKTAPAYIGDTNGVTVANMLANKIVLIDLSLSKVWNTGVVPGAGIDTAGLELGNGMTLHPATTKLTLMRVSTTTPAEQVTGYISIDLSATVTTTADLPKFDKFGSEYTYYLVEDVTGDWYSFSSSGILEIVATNTLKGHDLSIIKRWPADVDATLLPSTITFTLEGYIGTTKVYTRVSELIPVSGAGDISYTFTNLPKYVYVNGIQTDIKYILTESDNGFTLKDGNGNTTVVVSIGQNTVYNEIKTTSITVKKNWSFNGNAITSSSAENELLPDSITFALKRSTTGVGAADGVVVPGYETIEVTKAEGWEKLISNLPASDADNKTFYYWAEETTTSPAYKGARSADGTTYTNDLGTVELKVYKAWKDSLGANMADIDLPEEIFVTITGTAGTSYSKSYTLEIKKSDGWTNSIILPRYAYVDGEWKLIDYTVTEPKVLNGVLNGFNADQVSITGAGEGNYTATITNTLIPAKLIVTKNWVIDGKVDGATNGSYLWKPEGITLRLYRTTAGSTSREYLDSYATPTPVKVDEYTFTYTYDNLPSHNPGGLQYTYGVVETAIDGFDTMHSSISENPTYTFNMSIDNTFEVGSIKVVKDWDDNGNANNTRPRAITLTLKGYAQGITDPVVMQTYTTTGAVSDFEHTFSGLPKYYYSGNTPLPITYTIEESGANGYKLTSASHNVSLSGVVEGVTVGDTVEITNELIPAELSGKKDWAWVGNDSVGLIPDSITIQLWRESTDEPAHEVPDGSKVVTAADNWAWTFTGFPSTDVSGNPYRYWVVEEAPTGFDKIDAVDMDVTNTLKTVSIKVEKAWEDNENDMLSRPGKVSVTLVGAVAGTNYSKSYTEEIDTSIGFYTFENLPIYAYVGEAGSRHAELITYTVSEDSVPKGYTVSYVDGGVIAPEAEGEYSTEITNEMIPIEITVEKSWYDDEYMIDAGFSPRPTEINVRLRRSVNAAEDALFDARTDMVITLSEGNGWSHTFENLASHDENGYAYVYYISEWVGNYTSVPGYTGTSNTVITNIEGGTYTIQIDNTLELIEITALKEWYGDDKDGMYVQPDSITFVLTREGDTEFKLEKTVGEAEGWAWTFDNLAQYDTAGNGYVYIVEELDVPGYTSVREEGEGGFVFKNTLISLDVVVTKNWRNDTTATRPDEVIFTLTGTGTKNGVADVVYYQSSITVTKPNPDFGTTWRGSFEGVPKYDETGELIRYVVTEDSILGYDQIDYSFRPETDDAMKAASTYYATLTNEYGVTELYGEKTWVDEENAYSTRPVYITVELWRNVGGQGDAQVLDANSAPITQNVFYNPVTQKWSWSFTNLLKYEPTSGIAYTYYVVETRVDGYGYESVPDGNNLVNTLRTTSLGGTKHWETYGLDEMLPDSITVTLQRSIDGGQSWANVTKNGQTVQQTVTATDNWAWLFDGLPADVNGQDILYSVIETPVQGFDTAYDGDDIYNEMDAVDIEVTKDWQDGENEHDLRPDKIVVTVTSAQLPGWSDTLELNAGNNWTDSFENLPRYVTGTNTLITYTISEGTIYAYDVVVGTAEVHVNAEDDKYSITLENAIKLIDLRVIKDWDDEDNRYETRPGNLDITLYRNSHVYESATLVDDGNGNWTAEFTGLPKDDENGDQYEYTLGENVPNGYRLVDISDWEAVTGAERETYEATITNALKTTSENGRKHWRDSDNRDLARPDSIVITLQYNTSYFTDNWRNVPGVDPLEVFGPTWAWQFDGLPLEDENGHVYFYRVAEWTHLGYISSYAGESWISLVNVPVTIDLRVEKAWQDNDRTAYRPAILEIQLMSSTGATYSAELSEATGWTAEFTGLAKYDKDENLITYTLSETVPIGYTLVDISDWTAVTEDDQETYQATITNALETIDISVLKEWQDDGDDDYDLRPEKIVVTVTSEQLPGWSDTLELNAGNNWQASFEDLPRYIAGTNTLMTYSISEGTVYAYDVVVGTAEVHVNAEDDEYSVTLENAIKLIDLRVIKDWDDEENRYETRPSNLYVTLYRNNRVYESATLRADANGNWTAEFTNLPKEDENGVAYTYTLNENVPNGYRLVDISDWTAVTGAERETYQATVTNALKTTSEYGWKTWRDSENRDRARPDSIMITLQYRSLTTSWRDVPGVDALEVFGPTWEWQFDGLPAEDANGNQYTYRVVEWTHAGYTSSLSGESWMRLTNDPVTIDLRVEKVWQDSDRTSYRPATLEVQLTSSTGMTYRAALSAATGWAAEFTGLAKYDKDENLITYTLSETVPAGYTLVGISGWTAVADADRETYEATITNALATTSVTVTKRWVGATGTSVTVRLMDGTTQVASATITSPWTYTFDNLPKYRADGVTEIVYTVTEDSLTNFTTSISYTTNTDGTRSVTITNSYTPPTPTPTPTVTVTPSPTPTTTTTPVRTTTPTPEITPTPTPNIPTLPPTDQPVLRIITIEDLNIPLGAGINLNLGDAFD